MNLRSATAVIAAILMALGAAPGRADGHRPEGAPTATVVIVHGAWGGAWDWRETAGVLEGMGYEVHRATLTGLGERNHLLSSEVNLTTHITDVVNVLRWEQLDNVILVGHSYSGMVITGVAEVVPERIAQLVYFDAYLPVDGECALSVGQPGDAGDYCNLEVAERMLGRGARDGAIAPGWVEAGTPPPTDVPHPVATFIEPIRLAGKPGNGVPAAYIITRETAGGPDDFNFTAERAEAMGLPVVEYIGGHVPYRQDPEGIAQAFVQFGTTREADRTSPVPEAQR